MRQLMMWGCLLGVLAVVVAVPGCGDTKNAEPAVQPQKDKGMPEAKPQSRPKPIVEGN